MNSNQILDRATQRIEDNLDSYLTEKFRRTAYVAWVKVISEIPQDLSSIPASFEPFTPDLVATIEERREIGRKWLSIIDPDRKWGDCGSYLSTSSVGTTPLEDLADTMVYLGNKFERSRNGLMKIGLDVQRLTEAVGMRIIDMIFEASETGRKVTNGRVVSLVSIKPERFQFQEIPYWAFGAANVSLDIVNVCTNEGNILSLRAVDDALNGRNDLWEFFLPNSLGVAVSLVCTNEDGRHVLVGQDRNNAKTLTQRTGLVCAASGWIPAKYFSGTDRDHADIVTTGMNNELQEELWLTQISNTLSNIKAFRSLVAESVEYGIQIWSTATAIRGTLRAWVGFLDTVAQTIGKHELGLINTILIPTLLIMEDRRRNPEMLFLGVSDANFGEIEKQWQGADSRWESLKLVPVEISDVEKSINRLMKEKKSDQYNKEGEDTPLLSGHFLMGFLAYLEFLRKCTQEQAM